MEAEYGSIGNVRFPTPEDTKMYDGAGNVMLCKCGKPAGSGLFARKSFVLWCADCDPYKNAAQAKFVLKPLEGRDWEEKERKPES